MIRRILPVLFLIISSSAQAAPPELPFRVEPKPAYQQLSPEFCWFHPRAAALPGFGKQGRPAVILTTQKHLSANDHYSGLYYLRTDDLGETWTGPTEIPELAWRDGPNDETIAVADVTPGWHPHSGKLIAIGVQIRYSPAGDQLRDLPRSQQCVSATFDPRTDRWTSWEPLELPDTDTRFFLVAPGCVQWVVQPDGKILIPVYYRSKDNPVYPVTTLQCSFDGEKLKFLRKGDDVFADGGESFVEPSLIQYADRYFMTIRHQSGAYVTTSPDGLNFEKPKLWTFDDGQDLGSVGTQAHWLAHSDALFLTYTRRGANNDHIPGNRAPIFLAQVDPEKLHVLRKTEQIAIPERGVMLGNFGAAPITQHESWITDAEYISRLIDPEAGLKPYPRGADGTVWFSRIIWSKPNRLIKIDMN